MSCSFSPLLPLCSSDSLHFCFSLLPPYPPISLPSFISLFVSLLLLCLQFLSTPAPLLLSFDIALSQPLSRSQSFAIFCSSVTQGPPPPPLLEHHLSFLKTLCCRAINHFPQDLLFFYVIQSSPPAFSWFFQKIFIIHSPFTFSCTWLYISAFCTESLTENKKQR